MHRLDALYSSSHKPFESEKQVTRLKGIRISLVSIHPHSFNSRDPSG
jgi:hypothetical protein